MQDRSEPDSTARPLPLGALAGLTAAVTAFALAQGLSYPLFTFLMQRQGMTPAEIGLSAAMTPLGLILSAMFVPELVRRLGGRRLAVIAALSGALLFVLVGALQNWIAWYLLRFLIGLAINPLYILGEVWMMALAPDARRGRIMGIFNAVTGVGYAAGPLTLTLVGTDGWPPLSVAIFGFSACAVLLFLTTKGLRGFEPDEEGTPASGIWSFWTLAPALLLAVGVSAATQQSAYSLMPVFGAGYGLQEARLAALITMLSLGNILLQVPLGFLAERLGARTMIIACAALNAACVLSLPLLIEGPLVWPVLLVMGGVGYGVYTMSLVELGSRFRGQTLVAGNSAFALMWGVGGIAGPPGSGAAIQAFGPIGLPMVSAGLSAVLIVFAIYRAAVRRAS
ncbi:MFS transporter [Sphingomonas sp.]|uniref:MFS transporter n=1 Tax=Sphingomonas sp. TaxID=28214 RepID=UPI002FC60ACC